MALQIPLENAPISKHFTYREALYLPSWNRMANESDGLTQENLDSLIALFAKMDAVRDYFNMPIIIHCAMRPPAYNKLVGGAPVSAHMLGKAADFHVVGNVCDNARQKILNDNMLDTWNMRMENLPGSDWLHLGDDYVQGHNRFFIP